MVASSLTESAERTACDAFEKAGIGEETPGSERYQKTHMALIFEQGLSFSGFERNKTFLGGPGMRFRDVSDISGADSDGDCRATVVADFDDDGDPDIFVNAIQHDLHLLYRNDAGVTLSKGFVKVRLRATTGHPDAPGAIVKVRPLAAGAAPAGSPSTDSGPIQAQVLSFGSGFESQNAPELIFGLGAASQARVSVLWPGGALENFGIVAPNSRNLLVQGTGKPTAYPARTFRFKDPLPPGLRIRPGDRLERVVVKDLDGSRKTLSTVGNGTAGDSPVLLNFWATTCTSCLAELPVLDRLHRRGTYRVIGISLDPPGSAALIRKVWAKLKVKFDTFTVGQTQAEKLFDLQRLAIPVSIVVRNGRIERIDQGRLPEEKLGSSQ